ncbi:SIMPL domain-containing protein [Imtechella halotolerans]|uniref:DUF541 domain-containing protein n=1 Tax=Imtechella halotolerans K1 TaxID=946077 RepID=I0W6Z0_9FLAO|nr:SIMPL domain-containing protein [Imtechella halotolerans]EID72156.1 hypothetical protein W5A_11651 [Imtechella halotolerans K1]WMQ64258.1 SIMPL domain-containing protein [Imtechella halotolerans]
MKNILLLFAMASTIASAQTSTIQPTVSVSGEGIVSIVPDRVTVTVRVEHQGKTAEEVKSLNDKAVDGVIKFLKGQKIDARDYKTQHVNLSKNYDYQKKEYYYAANQTLTVLLKDIRKYDAIMQGLLNSGINRIDNVQFGSSQMAVYESQARKKAMEDALSKAKEYSEVLGQTIGKAISISEFAQSTSPYPVLRTMAMKAESADVVETLAAGEMEVSAKVNVVFELK